MHESLFKIINSHIPLVDKVITVIGASVVGVITLTDVQGWVAVSIGVGTLLALIPRIGIAFLEWNNKVADWRERNPKKAKPRRKPPTKKP